ncbi:Uncharacterized protein FWK35_00029905 [Aphis craccivora]|uniref:Uncharacterized protein n=1 Tax=Aphis craccivora TaxID=307492 RepID=A0A6G0W243_APHCR|nr:Uncharacterized protein FWK35_00029905 [Aphis craccivora]
MYLDEWENIPGSLCTSNLNTACEILQITVLVMMVCEKKCSITSQNNAPISNFGGGFRCKSEYPWYIIQVKSKHFPTSIFEKRKFDDPSVDVGYNLSKAHGFLPTVWPLPGDSQNLNSSKFIQISQIKTKLLVTIKSHNCSFFCVFLYKTVLIFYIKSIFF